LKTPLTTIKLLAHVLQQEELAKSERLDYSKTIAVECDRQIDFVGNLLDLSRIESGAYKLRHSRVEVRKLIESSVEVEKQRADSLGLRLTTDVAANLPPLKGNFEALRRVIRGLVDNAIKYTPEGGIITVSGNQVDDALAITIRDTGKGIPEADLPHVFEKFYRAGSEFEDEGLAASPGTAAPGVGLGLYLAQHIVEQLNGKIIVESKEGRGTTFTVFLPRWSDSGSSGAKHEENAGVEEIVSS
jgi:two-component system phosphate regulon sensor histidine kinase PhoR